MVMKANMKDILHLQEKKPERDDDEIVASINEIRSLLDERATMEDLRAQNDEQTLINEALCSENCLARFVWKSGELKKSNVPWEI